MLIAADPVARFLLLAFAGLGALVVVLVSMKRPWWITVMALASLPLIPSWVGLSVGPFFVSAHMGLLAVAIVAILREQRAHPQTNLADLALGFVFVLIIAGVPLQLTTLTQVYTYVQWLLAYGFARLAVHRFGLPRVAAVAAITFSVAGLALLVELATGFNPWTRYAVFPNSLYTRWSNLQSRGGVLRAEGAFGHSIAAGCSLALAAVLTIDARLRLATRVLAIAVMCAAILTTLSRIGIVTAAVGIGVAVLFARTSMSVRARIATLLVGAVGAVTYGLVLAGIFSEAGSEASNSAAYRLWILELLPNLQPLGYASSAARSTSGVLSFSGYQSVDNAVLYFALSNGWVPTVLLLCILAVAAVRLLSRRAGVATAALVATIPALVTVALITQYALVFWLVAGLAASESRSARDPKSPPVQDPSPPLFDPATDLATHSSKERRQL